MSDAIGDEDLFEEPSMRRTVAPAAAPSPAPDAAASVPRPAAAGVDVLAGPNDAHRPRPRATARGSKPGTLLVLVITAAVVLAGVWLVNLGKGNDSAAQTGAGTSVTMPGLSGVPAPAVGKPAQDFTLTTWDGKKVALSSLKGKNVWLTFGASWCSGCQAEMPDIEAASKAYAGKNVVVVGVNISEDNAAVQAYAQRVGLTYPIGADPNNAIADSYAVSAIPSHFFIDSTGVIREIRIGALSPTTMNSTLDKLVAS